MRNHQSTSLTTKPARVMTEGKRIHVFLFLVGMSSFFSFTAIGKIFLPDIILALALPYAIFHKPNETPWKYAIPIILMALVWLLGAVVTDVIRQSPFQNYSRGWAKIVFFIIAIVSLVGLSKAKIDRMMCYFGGLAVSGILGTVISPDEYQRGEPWKFGFSVPLAILTVIVASLPLQRRLIGIFRSAGMPGVMGALNLILNYRSHYVILSAATGVSALAALAQKLAPRRKLVTPVFVIGLVLLALVGAMASAGLYSSLAGSGALGEKAKAKFDIQSNNDLGILLSGRSESFASFSAIADSPIIGHGSWAEDRYYVTLRILMLRERGILNKGVSRATTIPSHSYLFGSWVEAGVLGAVFWIFVLVQALRALFYLIDIRSNATPFASYLLASLFWAIPFSPFGAEVRFFVAGQLCIVIWAVREAKLARFQPAQIPSATGHRTLHAG